VGIPRALSFYLYYPLWRAFLEGLGAEVVVSPPTGRRILRDGLAALGGDVCLPVKVAAGHLLALASRVDFLFLPRMVSAARREYACPKLMGLPEVVRHSMNLPPLLAPDIDRYRRDHWPLYRVALAVGRRFNRSVPAVLAAYRRAVGCYQRYRRLLEQGHGPDQAAEAALAGRELPPPPAAGRAVALLGHPYTVYDQEISLDLAGRLARAGLGVRTAEQVPEAAARRAAAGLPKHLFWTAGQQVVGAAFHYLAGGTVAGMISVMSFGCGPDSMTGELVARRARQVGRMPHLGLTLDEHGEESGVLTRLEAFLDMVGPAGEGGTAACG